MVMKRCIEDDPGLAGIETWMRSLGDGWETVLAGQQKAMFPYLCSYANLVVFPGGEWFIMTPTICYQRDDAGQHWCAR